MDFDPLFLYLRLFTACRDFPAVLRAAQFSNTLRALFLRILRQMQNLHIDTRNHLI